MQKFITLATLMSTLLFAQSSTAQSAPPPTTEFAPTGTLRVAINHSNPILATRDPNTGELKGIAVDIARELARRLAVPVTLIPFDAAGKISDTARTNVWDLAFLGIDPARAQDIDYSASYVELEGTYLVPAGSTLRTMADVDRPNIRISVTTKSAYDLFLTRAIRNAELVRAPSTPESIDIFATRKLEALAAPRTALVPVAARLPGSRILEGHFMTIPQAAGIPKGRPAAARYLHAFIEEMKSSGFVAQALKRHGLTANDALVAAPAANPVVNPADALAPTGTLRVTFLAGNPTQGKVDPATGEVTGPIRDLADKLAQSLNLPLKITPLAGVPAVLESVKTHQADLGFVAADPSRATEVDFSQVYLLGWASYMVPANAPQHTVNEMDQPGLKVAATPTDSPGLYLSRNLKNATFVPVKSQEEALAMLQRGEIQGFATNRQRLLQLTAADPRFRVLTDNYFAVQQAIAVPKGSLAALDLVNRFLDDSKASGLIQAAIQRAGLTGAADQAPPRAK